MPLISFDNIEIVTATNNITTLNNVKLNRTENFQIKYEFDFNIEYDTIIHVRVTDRLNANIKHDDFSNVNELIHS